MAIGNTLNQNPFGTNFNPEDEEEKKARLAAQGAMMGAGFPALDSNIVAQVPGIQNIKNPGAFNPPEPALKNALLGMLERADEREAQGLPRQAAPGIIDAPSGALDLGATPSVTPPAETPSVGAQEQGQAILQGSLMGSYQAPDGQSIGMFQGQPNAPITQEQLNSLSGQIVESSSPFISGGLTDASGQTIAGPAGRPEGMSPFIDQSGKVAYADPETANRMNALAGQEAQENRAAQQRFLASDAAKEMSNRQLDSVINSTYSQESKAREARLDARPDFNEAVSDRDRRAARGDDISMADQTAMAKANARDATPTEVARGNQVANALGVDLETGQATGAFKPSDILARERFEYDKQQDLIDDDTSDNATTRKIATIKQANPDISDADAAAIASGSVRVVSNPITGETQLLNLTTSESKQITGQSSSDVDFDVAVPEQTLFSRAAKFTGAYEAGKRAVQGVTGQVGLDVATEESLGAAQDFETAQNELVRAFRESSRYAASEAAALKKELNISLSPFEDPKSAEAKLRSIDKSLDRRYENEVATFRDTSFPPSDRQDARMRAKAIAEFRANLGVPTSSTQGNVPSDVDPKEWEFMSTEERNLFN